MTEEEWLAATDSMQTIEFLRRQTVHRTKSGRRRLRNVACGCTHRVSQLLTHRGKVWLGQGEKLADGEFTKEDRQKFKAELFGPTNHQRADHLADSAAYFTLASHPATAAEGAGRCAASAIGIHVHHGRGNSDAARTAEFKAQAGLVRDIFGNPFRPVTLDPRWQTETAVALASGIYAERAFDRMPILADALEESGCDDADILRHCREPAEHARGCWVVDLVLGKG